MDFVNLRFPAPLVADEWGVLVMLVLYIGYPGKAPVCPPDSSMFGRKK